MALDEGLLYCLIGERIRKARSRRIPKMSQAQLASKLGISRASIVNIEAGRQRPPIHVLWQLAEVLETELSLLLPSQAEYAKQGTPTKLDEYTAAQIDAVANGNPTTRRLLTEFIGRVKVATKEEKS